ncbi:uncharacterized protein LOC124185746 isoform X1 [Neodiprion fabricii]|uniref:uncharacterized protein LOC124185746 isoform X1 n=1 Tax=Neodiprion fabricii TaxID=2872261 RepID=UPI001ED95C7A|nr:uncharacterized protein LOC124185746 isoform X1 [Neodiprion fabricii]XP_046432766.1 uncharacterized protein LOC124185746 isoform X1 [Neodiprion fabricii]XP_046432767.1 uncharacterized protein LOC124185746 isoform X1 [Neodiprion fabricii]XP_046432768.1 uncharacterized protein LOC124185746 isoform X1 [Neodiprion fabricii]XP_046432769.1 uncharacterized protein LOC124185746 isoform X1 [Neodiprion fabricii]XP_046432771.1 uncharacterized protein LOC124185746 isoform X1 [Neodiprion fabricii]XP_04
MADNEQTYHDFGNSESIENFFNDGWTIIGGNCSKKDDSDEGSNNDMSVSDAHDTFGSIEVLSSPDTDAVDNETRSDDDKPVEDSDGISVITDCDCNQLIATKKFGEINGCRNHLCSTINKFEKTGEKSSPQVGTILNFVIACSLAAIIGLGAGRILRMDDECPITSAIDFHTIKAESDMLINRIKELNEVKNVLDEIKASIPQVKRAQEKLPIRGSKSRTKRFQQREKHFKISDTYIFDPDTTILEQLQISLNTLCSVIDDINPENDFISLDASKTQSIVTDLIEFKNIVHTVVKELGNTERPKQMEFLRNAETRIRDVCESLLTDLTYTIHGLTMKIHHKLNKVRHKLNKRLCLLKTSGSLDEKVSQSLEENNSFLKSCDRVLNVTLKPNARSIETKEKRISNRKIYPKTTGKAIASLSENSSSGTENDFSKDYSSDSSMPDLTYNYNKNIDFWKKKPNVRLEGKDTKQESGRILLENGIKRGKKRTKIMKSSRDSQSCKNSVMEILVPAETCPMSQNLWVELESICDKMVKPEVPNAKEKPLYSTILKSTSNAVPSEQGKLDEEKPHSVKFPSEVSAEEKDNLRETKHDVTPSESDINVLQNVKIMKEQWNANIRQSVVQHDVAPGFHESPLCEEISEEVYKEKLLQSNEKIPSLNGSLKICRKGEKCSNDSTTSTQSKKKVVSNDENKDNNKKRKKKRGKKWIKTQNNYDTEDLKKVMYNEKTLPPPKIRPTKIQKDSKKQNTNQKSSGQLSGDWQLQRSHAREMHRDGNHRSEWFFDRASSRQDAREKVFAKIGSKCYGPDKCRSNSKERIDDEESYDYWVQPKETRDRKHWGGRAGFTAKKMVKMLHRKNIMQTKHH